MNSPYGCNVANCPHIFYRECIETLPEQIGIGQEPNFFPCRRHDPKWLYRKKIEVGLIVDPNDQDNNQQVTNDGNIVIINIGDDEEEGNEENELDLTFDSLCSDLIDAVR